MSFTLLLDGFTYLFSGLRFQLAVRGAGPAPLPTPLVLATFGWLSRSLRRLALLIARVQAGRPTRSAVQRAARPTPVRPHPAVAPPLDLTRPARLPGRHGWLLPLVPMHAPLAGVQLQHLLSQPEMAALIAAAPSIGRVLRPLARMLGVALPTSLQPQRPARRPRRKPCRPPPPAPPVRLATSWDPPARRRRRGDFGSG